jgi:glycosyltransferase involved in cell wall biosynthesis
MGGLVSVIVPCFNYGRFLVQCLASLRAQSYSNWECLIVDDGSTDDSAQIAERLAADEKRVAYVRQTNSGLSAARNAGLARARGEFIQFLDADDLLEPQKLQCQVEFLRAHPDVDVVVGSAAFFRSDPRRTRPLRMPRRLAHSVGEVPGEFLRELVNRNFIPVNSVLARRSALEEESSDVSLRAHEDWDLWLRCAVRGRRFALASWANGRALVRLHRANMSSARELMFATAIRVRQKIHGELPAALQTLNAERLVEAKLRLGLELLRQGRLKDGWALYREGMQEARYRIRGVLLLPLAFPGVMRVLAVGRTIYRSLR